MLHSRHFRVLGEGEEELRELYSSQEELMECGEEEAELCAVGPPVTCQIVLTSLTPWTPSCNSVFYLFIFIFF